MKTFLVVFVLSSFPSYFLFWFHVYFFLSLFIILVFRGYVRNVFVLGLAFFVRANFSC